MNKDLNNIDDIFNEAYHNYEEAPSSIVWDKLNATLDEEEVNKYKRRFIGWRRIALLLLLLLGGTFLYISRDSSKIKEENKNFKINQKENNTDKNIGSISPDEVGNKKIVNPQADNSIITFHKKKASPPEKLKETTNLPDAIVKEESPLPTGLNKKKAGMGWKENWIEDVKKTDYGNRKTSITDRLKKNDLINDAVSVALNNTRIISGNELLQTMKDEGANNKRFFLSSISEPIKNSPPSLEIMNPLSEGSKTNKQLSLANKRHSKPFKPYWAVSTFLSHDWNNNKLKDDELNGVPQEDDINDINERERIESSNTTGIMVSRQLTSKLGIKAGISYSSTNIIIAPHQIYAKQQPNGKIAYQYNTASGFGFINPGFGLTPAVGDSLKTVTGFHNYQKLSIPVMFTFTFQKKKFSLTPSAGISANFITTATVRTRVEDALNQEGVKINGLNGMNPFYVGFISEVNLQYNIKNNWSLNLLPVFKYAITPVAKGNAIKTYPYSLGIGIGLTYKF